MMLSGLLADCVSLSFQILFTVILVKYSVGISFVSSTVSSFSGVSNFIVPVTLFSIFSLLTSTSLYTSVICFVIVISFVPLVYVSMSSIVSSQVIVFSSALYVPPDMFDFCSSISYGNVSIIVTVAFPV